jgi:hypothetical protein
MCSTRVIALISVNILLFIAVQTANSSLDELPEPHGWKMSFACSSHNFRENSCPAYFAV